MITESGRVVAVSGDKVWVQTIRTSACESCSARSGCGQRVLASVSGGKANQVLVPNTLGVGVGDEVKLAVEESALMRASLLVYALPLLLMVIGAVLGQQLGLVRDVGAMLGAGVGLVSGFAIARSVQSGQSARFDPVLVDVASTVGRVHL